MIKLILFSQLLLHCDVVIDVYPMSHSHNAIDYFASLGRAPGSFVCQSFPLTIDEDSPPLSGSEVWNEAITEIIVVGPGELLIHSTLEDLNTFVLFRRSCGRRGHLDFCSRNNWWRQR